MAQTSFFVLENIMKSLILLMICLGSALMVYNIIRYYGFLNHIRKMESLEGTNKTAVIPLLLLIGFLAGYLIVGFVGNPDMVVALILFGGSIYVSLVLLFLYRIVGQLEQNEIRLGALYEELRNDLNSLTENSLAVFRVNLTRDTIDERSGEGLYESDLAAQSYSELMAVRRNYLLIEKADWDEKLFSREGLIEYFKEGHTTAEEILFCKTTSGQSRFVKLRASLAMQPSTGDIIAFITESLYNDEKVSEALMNKALVEQYDMIAYLADGQLGVVIGNPDSNKKGNIFPDSKAGEYEEYINHKIGPVLCGTHEEKTAVLEALNSKEIEKRLEKDEPYEVVFACEIDGETYYKRFVFYTVDRNAKFYLLLKSDTTDARREEILRNQKLQVALEDARNASAAKTVFLSNMSHDIRTPMNAIIGYIKMAKNSDNDPKEVKAYLDKLDSSSQYMLALLNDVLEMSRIESGKLELESVPVNLCELLDDVRDMFSTQMKEKNLDFSVSYEDIRDSYVLCDETRLNRVLLNLLSNAFKFTPESGSISVVLSQNKTITEGFGEYELRVKDSGIGMKKEFANRVFDAFERERSSTVSGIQGTGLGMAITKNIIDMMDGSIEVETEPDKGTEFIIKLSIPLQDLPSVVTASKAQKSKDEERECDFTSIRALLVEDQEINREIASFILGQMGFMVDTAENGKIALEKVEASEPGYYGLILMDIQMPVMNGYEAARQIRSLPNPQLAGIPIVATTANAFIEDIREAKKAGMNAHISKPLDVNQMKKTLTRILM